MKKWIIQLDYITYQVVDFVGKNGALVLFSFFASLFVGYYIFLWNDPLGWVWLYFIMTASITYIICFSYIYLRLYFNSKGRKK